MFGGIYCNNSGVNCIGNGNVDMNVNDNNDITVEEVST
jgi:hypothetical protein